MKVEHARQIPWKLNIISLISSEQKIRWIPHRRTNIYIFIPLIVNCHRLRPKHLRKNWCIWFVRRRIVVHPRVFDIYIVASTTTKLFHCIALYCQHLWITKLHFAIATKAIFLPIKFITLKSSIKFIHYEYKFGSLPIIPIITTDQAFLLGSSYGTIHWSYFKTYSTAPPHMTWFE